ncbi:MAG: hypothetical protein LH632_03965 [Rhodoferax sp.]|nr:hypothetical protein [Rhodoferax sp.]
MREQAIFDKVDVHLGVLFEDAIVARWLRRRVNGVASKLLDGKVVPAPQRRHL